MKKSSLALMILAVVHIAINAQPYTYTVTYNDSLPGIYAYSIFQYNFQNKSFNLIEDSLYINDYTYDNSGNWLIIDQPRDATLFINHNENKRYLLDSEILSLGALLFSKINNKFYLFYDESDDENLTGLLTFSSTVDNMQALLSLPTSDFVDQMYNREAFLSDDEKTIYFSSSDTASSDLYPKNTIINYFSTQTNSIARNRPASEMGYPDAFSHSLNKGKKGVAVISSFLRTPDDYINEYFRIFNFDKNFGYAFIKSRAWSIPYFTHNGKYLVLSNIKYDSTKYTIYNKGIFDVFNAQTGELLKTVSYPANGHVHFYDDYPNELFYFLRDSTGKSDSYIINIDDIVNTGLQVKLTNSNGTKLPGGSLQYYEGGWKNATDNGDGTFNVDTQLKTVSLRMTYEYGAQTKSNVSVGADTVVFQTVNAAVKLQNSQGSAIDTGKVQYYAGGWRDFGATANGTANKELLPVNYTFRMNYGYASNDKAQSLDTNSTVIFKTINSSVQLKDSQNNLINEQSVVQYYSGGWRQFGLTQGGISSKELLPNNYTFRISYGYASNDKQQNIGVNPVVDFQTVKAVVQLKNSQNQLIDPGVVQYYSGGWRQFGVTTNGSASKELLPNNYTFRMNYGFANFDKQQSISTNPLVEFQTINATVQLKDSKGNFIDQGTVQYYSGGWREFGSIQSGISNKELLPGNYTFRISYAFASKDKLQNVGVNPVVEFQTVNAEVQLRNSINNLIDQGTVQYYSGGWRDFGATLNGIANKELLANQYTFRMNYEFASNDKSQDLSLNPSVIFQTVKANVELRNSQGNLLDEGVAQYYSGGWRSLGTTSGGTASRELLPNNYTFRMTNEFISNDKSQNIGTNNNVIFNTVQCVVRARDNQNQPINNAAASYYSGGWRTIGSTINGEVIKELLPANLTFRINYAGTQQDKTQNLLTNNIVEFIIGQ